MLSNIPVKFHDKYFSSYMRHNLKIANFTKSRAITLQILNKSNKKYPGAQLYMLINIHVKFHDPRSNSFWATCDTSWKLQLFTKSMAIILTKQKKKSTNETPDAPLHMLSNIPVKFHDSRSNTMWATCDTSWILQIFTNSRAITLQILQLLKKSTQQYPGA
jgi:hypothetical protein